MRLTDVKGKVVKGMVGRSRQRIRQPGMAQNRLALALPVCIRWSPGFSRSEPQKTALPSRFRTG
jgi:hypothetical protein